MTSLPLHSVPLQPDLDPAVAHDQHAHGALVIDGPQQVHAGADLDRVAVGSVGHELSFFLFAQKCTAYVSRDDRHS